MSTHSWGAPNREDPALTVRVCAHCGMRRLTHHEPGNRAYATFACASGLTFHGEGTPPCVRLARAFKIGEKVRLANGGAAILEWEVQRIRRSGAPIAEATWPDDAVRIVFPAGGGSPTAAQVMSASALASKCQP